MGSTSRPVQPNGQMLLIEKEIFIGGQNRQMMPLRNGTDQKVGILTLAPLLPANIKTFGGAFKVCGNQIQPEDGPARH